MTNSVRILIYLIGRNIAMKECLAGELQSCFELRLHDMRDAHIAQSLHLFNALGPCDDVDIVIEFLCLALEIKVTGVVIRSSLALRVFAASRIISFSASPNRTGKPDAFNSSARMELYSTIKKGISIRCKMVATYLPTLPPPAMMK